MSSPPEDHTVPQRQECFHEWVKLYVEQVEDTRPPIFNSSNISAPNSGSNVNGPGPPSATTSIASSMMSECLIDSVHHSSFVAHAVPECSLSAIEQAYLTEALNNMQLLENLPALSYATSSSSAPSNDEVAHQPSDFMMDSQTDVDSNMGRSGLTSDDLSMVSYGSGSREYSIDRYRKAFGPNERSYHLPSALDDSMSFRIKESYIAMSPPEVEDFIERDVEMATSGIVFGTGAVFDVEDGEDFEGWPVGMEVSIIVDE